MKSKKVKKIVVDAVNEGVTELAAKENPNEKVRVVLNQLKLFRKLKKRQRQMINFGQLITGLFHENGEECQKCLDVVSAELDLKLLYTYAKEIEAGYSVLVNADNAFVTRSIYKYAQKHDLLDVILFGNVPLLKAQDNPFLDPKYRDALQAHTENTDFDKSQIQLATRPLDQQVNIDVSVENADSFKRNLEANKAKVAETFTPVQATPTGARVEGRVVKTPAFGLIFPSGKITRYLGSPINRELYDEAATVIDLETMSYRKLDGVPVVGIYHASPAHREMFKEHEEVVQAGPAEHVWHEPYDDNDLQIAWKELDQAWEDRMTLPPSEQPSPQPLWARLWFERSANSVGKLDAAGKVLIEAAHRELRRERNS